jgi:hypothetical protein
MSMIKTKAKMSITERKMARVIESRQRHHEALAQMLAPKLQGKQDGLQTWRKLRRLEAKAGALALQLCNGPELSEAEQERIKASIHAGVERVFGRKPPGFFINLDPRGYALKLEPGSVPYPLREDWGRYQILAPVID